MRQNILALYRQAAARLRNPGTDLLIAGGGIILTYESITLRASELLTGAGIAMSVVGGGLLVVDLCSGHRRRAARQVHRNEFN